MSAIPDPGLRSWHEPDPSRTYLLLLAAGLGACLVVGVTSGVARNWDLLVVAVVLATALVADLLRGLRERDFVVAGPDGLVVRVRGTTTSWPWAAVSGFGHEPVRLGRRRPVMRLVDGTTGRLPREVPVDELVRWAGELGGS